MNTHIQLHSSILTKVKFFSKQQLQQDFFGNGVIWDKKDV